MVPMDRASNNVAIVCKRYYAVVIINKIGVIGHRNHTYFKINESCDEIINENTEYAKRFGFKITEKEKRLPIMYWIPKRHKNPTGARFIIAFKISTTKQISKSVFSVFKLAYFQIEVWVLQNSDPLNQSLKNKWKKAR